MKHPHKLSAYFLVIVAFLALCGVVHAQSSPLTTPNRAFPSLFDSRPSSSLPNPQIYFLDFYYNLKNFYDITVGPSYGGGPRQRGVSVAVNNHGMVTTGWNALEVVMDASFFDGAVDDSVAPLSFGYYLAGYAEGYVTAQSILEHYNNMEIASMWTDGSNATRQWVEDHWTYMTQLAEDTVDFEKERIRRVSSRLVGDTLNGTNVNGLTYTQQLRALLAQLEGMSAGVNAALLANPALTQSTGIQSLSTQDIFLLNFVFEFYDVAQAMEWLSPQTSPMTPKEKEARRMYTSHCSALVRYVNSSSAAVKIHDDNLQDDLYVTHNTWSSLNSMYRQQKTYLFGLHRITFSSYPGTVHSGDDFYVLSNVYQKTTATKIGTEEDDEVGGTDTPMEWVDAIFVVQETTNENSNPDTAPYVVPTSISEFIRVNLAHTFTTTSGENWCATFASNNSGTYNNQFMVANLGHFRDTLHRVLTPADREVLWVIEQMPGMMRYKDQTLVLATQGYWASYNRPFYEDVFAWSGFLARRNEMGSYFSYDHNYRANIFRRNATQVQSIDDLKLLMRYNDYKHDPESLVPNCTGAPNNICSPLYCGELSIAARADLSSPSAKFGVLTPFIGQQNEAAIDAKIMAASFVSDTPRQVPPTAVWLINGPVNGGASNIPVFRFSRSAILALRPATAHIGIPDEMNFQWVQATPTALFGNGGMIPPAMASDQVQYLFQIDYDCSVLYQVANFQRDLATLLLQLFSSRTLQSSSPPVREEEGEGERTTRNGTTSLFSQTAVMTAATTLTPHSVLSSCIRVSLSLRGGYNRVRVSFTIRDENQDGSASGLGSFLSTSTLENLLIWATPAQLTAGGFANLDYRMEMVPDTSEFPRWLPSFVCACVFAGVLVVITALRLRSTSCTSCHGDWEYGDPEMEDLDDEDYDQMNEEELLDERMFPGAEEEDRKGSPYATF